MAYLKVAYYLSTRLRKQKNYKHPESREAVFERNTNRMHVYSTNAVSNSSVNAKIIGVKHSK
jgi:hypothetical protein